jgi:hypothetical protein
MPQDETPTTGQAGDRLLTLREVAALTDTPLPTIRRWCYKEALLPHEHVGPTHRVRVRWSVLVTFFGHLTS